MHRGSLMVCAAAGLVLLTASCQNNPPEDVTPSGTPSVSQQAAEDSVQAGAGAVLSDTTAFRDSVGAATDSLGAATDTLFPADST